MLSPGKKDFDPDAKVGDTYFKAVIPDDPEFDDIWLKIQKGLYNKISIYGVRTQASSECQLLPHQRTSPCVTKGIRLWSFSLVGDNAINPGSYIKIAKAISPDLCREFEQRTNELIKAAFPDVIMAPDADQQDQGAGAGDVNDPIVKADVVTKTELDPVIQDVTLIKGEMTEVKTGIAGILELLKKADPPANDDEPPVVKADDYITKATLEPVLDLIVKAKVELAVAEIKKAYDVKIAEMQTQIDAFGSETIRKGGSVVFLDSDGTATGKVENPFLANLEALGA